jgi:hypothetical protein
MTFGLAAPLLGITICVSTIVAAVLWRFLIVKFLHRGKVLHVDTTLRIEAATAHASDGLLGGTLIVVIIVSIFWSLLIFDMTADIYGNIVGFIVVVVVFLLVPTVYAVTVYGHRRRISRKSGVPHGGGVELAPMKSVVKAGQVAPLPKSMDKWAHPAADDHDVSEGGDVEHGGGGGGGGGGGDDEISDFDLDGMSSRRFSVISANQISGLTSKTDNDIPPSSIDARSQPTELVIISDAPTAEDADIINLRGLNPVKISETRTEAWVN